MGGPIFRCSARMTENISVSLTAFCQFQPKSTTPSLAWRLPTNVTHVIFISAQDEISSYVLAWIAHFINTSNQYLRNNLSMLQSHEQQQPTIISIACLQPNATKLSFSDQKSLWFDFDLADRTRRCNKAAPWISPTCSRNAYLKTACA